MSLVKGVDPRVWASILSQKRPLSIGLACSAGSAILLGLTTLLIKETLSAVENGQPQRLSMMALAVVGIYGARYFLTRGQMTYLSQAAAQLTTDLRKKLFAKLQRLPLSYFNEKRSGSIQSVLTNDVNVYQSAVTSVRDAIDGPIKVLIGFVSIFVIQWQLALVSLAILPFMTVFIQRNAKKMRVAQAQVQEDLGNLTAVTQEQLLGTRVIKAFGAEDVSIARFGSLADKTYESQMRAARRVAALKPMVELIGAAALAITVYFCGYLVTHGQLTVAQLGSFIYSLDVINQGAKNLGALRQTMAQVQAAADRIHEEILDVPETVTDSNGARELPVPVGRVEFRDVTFEYPDGTKALDKLNFVIEPGTSLALVGPSGAGKSTIADLLLRFHDPTGGQILFDGIDIRELKTAWYRKQFGVVPQQTFLFAGTVRDNILLGAPYADESSIHEAAKMAHADDFVNSSSLRYDTALGERGVRLSGGEGQRIAIARALVRDPLVLVLDEATSNLDAVSEKAVTEALDEVMHTRTTLFIAHRLTTAARADKILVLRRGEAVESGSHQELLAAGGTYAAMFKAFATGVWDSGHD